MICLREKLAYSDNTAWVVGTVWLPYQTLHSAEIPGPNPQPPLKQTVISVNWQGNVTSYIDSDMKFYKLIHQCKQPNCLSFDGNWKSIHGYDKSSFLRNNYQLNAIFKA